MGEGATNGRAGAPPAIKPGAMTALLQELAAAPREASPGAWEAVLRPGASVGRFALIRELGRGGFGVVWEARDAELGRSVALKAVRSGGKPGLREERLLKEAEAAAQLSHPNIVTLYDAGRTEQGPYLVLELLRGETLEQRLERGPVPAPEAVRVAVEVAKGLAHAHAQGVIHRDLKPANVFLCQDGQVKVLDFGMAHAFGQRRVEGGTLGYMAPEQQRRAPEDERTDVFALGLVLHRMLAGALPSLGARGHGSRPALGLPQQAGLSELVGRMLDQDPVARPRDASEVLAALAGAQRELERAIAPAAAGARRSRIGWRGALALAVTGGVIVAAVVGWFARREARLRWALQEALPRVAELVDRGRYPEAVALAEQVEAVLPDNPKLVELWSGMSKLFDVQTRPEGAEVEVREYAAPDGAWRSLGRAPVRGVRLPLGLYRWRIAKEGFATVERAHGWIRPVGDRRVALEVRLDEVGTVPPEMVRVSGGETPAQLPGLDHLPAVRLGDYLIDRTEVTNRQFKRFVEAGGYRNPGYWRHSFVRDGRRLSWAEAMALFHDRTGRPGPATWDSGDYPEGQGDLPVAGVSWHEAAAFAAFAGKALPTVYQWSRAAGLLGSTAWATPFVVLQSNFGVKGLAPVASQPGMGPFGTYDMAGNAKEWCWNADGDKRYILGGAWDEPSYMFTDPDAQSPLARRPNYGFRLAKALDGDTDPSAASPLARQFRDYARERPVGREIARAYARAYAYDKAPLDARVEAVDDGSERWRKEKVSFAAAYGGERIPAYLFTPRHVAPPYQTVVFFPGSFVMYQRSSESLDYMWILAPLIKSGRALLYPVYKSTYERGEGLTTDLPSPTAAYREHVAMWVKDLRRSLDYLETRPDLDASRVALYGFSWGAMLAPLLLAADERMRVGIVVGGGLAFQQSPPEADPFNFAPLVTRPILMVNGRYDYFFPAPTSQVPLFERLGSPAKDKRHAIFETGHLPPNDLLTKEVLDWLDRYLGPAR